MFTCGPRFLGISKHQSCKNQPLNRKGDYKPTVMLTCALKLLYKICQAADVHVDIEEIIGSDIVQGAQVSVKMF